MIVRINDEQFCDNCYKLIKTDEFYDDYGYDITVGEVELEFSVTLCKECMEILIKEYKELGDNEC